MEKSIELQKKQNWIRVKILILNLSLALIRKCGELQEHLGLLQNHSQVKLKVLCRVESSI